MGGAGQYYEIRGKYGKIYLYSAKDDVLAVHITSNKISNRIERENKDAFNLYLKTSEGSTFLFKEENLEMAAKFIKARRRKQFTVEQLQTMAERMKKVRELSGKKA